MLKRQERGPSRISGVGVESALLALGQGLVEHPSNEALRERLASGELSLHAFHNLLLRTIYRLLFLFVAEDRDC